MTDFVITMQRICDENNIQFHYGNKSHLNLIDANSDLEPNKTHFLLFPLKRGNLINNTRLVSGNFFFVRPDEFAQEYYNETAGNDSEAKYNKIINPLISELDLIENKIKWCEGFDIVSLESIDAVDVLDANMTGLWVTFQVKIYE